MSDSTDGLLDLLRVGERAAARHKRKVADLIKAGAKDLLVSEDVVTSAGGKLVRVRVRLLESPRFIFDYHDMIQVGIGDPEPGDVLRDENPGEDGDGEGAGAWEGEGEAARRARKAERALGFADVLATGRL